MIPFWAKLPLKPFLTLRALHAFFLFRRELLARDLRISVARARRSPESMLDAKEWLFVDRVLRALSRRIPSVSPCMVHAFSLFYLGGAGTRLLIYVRRPEDGMGLDAHAAIARDGEIFSLAESRHDEVPFLELVKGAHGKL